MSLIVPFGLKLLSTFNLYLFVRPVLHLLCMIMAYDLFHMVIPIFTTKYATVPSFVHASAEIFFSQNSYCCCLLFYLYRAKFYQIYDALQETLAQIDESSISARCTAIHMNDTVAHRVKFFLQLFFIMGLIYSVFPFTMSTWSYVLAVNKTEATLFFILEEEFYGFDIHNNFTVYAICSVFVSLGILLTEMHLILKSTTVCIVMKYCTLMFQLVRARIEELKHCAAGAERSVEIGKIVQLHNRAIGCAKSAAEFLKFPMLLHFMLVTGGWCLLLFYMSVTGLDATAVGVLVLIVMFTAETFIYCKLGTELTEASLNVGEAVYNHEWYNESLSDQKALRMILQVSRRKVGITAAGFYFIEYQRFAAVVRLSYSIYLFLMDVL